VARSPFGDIESTKVVSDLVAPVTGTVVSRNDSVLTDPSLINSDPHGSGWLLEVTVTSDEDFGLLGAEAYRALTSATEIE
jgi:glycine cleavage system H protein